MISTFHPTKRLKALPKKATSSEYFLINSTTITIYSQQLTIATFIIHSNQNRTKMKRGIKWAQVFAGDFDCEQQETIGNRRITPKEKCQKLNIAHLLLQLFYYGCVAYNYIMPYYDLQAIHVFEQFLPLLLHIFFIPFHHSHAFCFQICSTNRDQTIKLLLITTFTRRW